MKQTLRLTLALLVFTLLAGKTYSQNFYGWNLYHRTDDQKVGPCKASIGNPTDVTLLRRHDYGICAGAFVGSRYYCYTYEKNESGSRPIAFGIYNFETGAFTKVADYSQMTTLFYDMAYNYSNKTMYALGLKGENSVLLTVSIETGKTKEVLPLSKRYYTLAIDLEGHFYSEDEYGELYQLSLDGSESLIGGGEDYFPLLQTQSMSFDHNTGSLYWVCPTGREGTQLLTISKETGYVTANVELPDEMQIVGFDIPYISIPKGAPAIPLQLNVEADIQGGHTAQIKVQAPLLDYESRALSGEIKVVIQRNSKEIKSLDGCKPGETYTLTDQVPSDTVYTYTAYAENKFGKGEEKSVKVFVGEDVPAAVTNLSIEKLSDSSCKITWDKPHESKHGGYLSPNITYSIYRLPEGVCVANDLAGNSYTDEIVGSLGLFQWRVVPSTKKGEGESATTATLLLGHPYTIPYESGFTAAETPFWTIVDANKDGTTWKETMDNGIGCSYSSQSGDDWLISSPLQFVEGVRYKVKVQAAAYSYEYEEKMSLHLLSSSDIRGESIEIADFVVGNEEGEKRDYVAYFSLSPNSSMSRIAIRMHSDPDKYRLTLYKVSIVEASEGTISGEVKAGETAVEHATVRLFTPTPIETKSDNNGLWRLSAIPEGTYRLTIEKEGFAPIDTLVAIQKEQETNLSTQLQPLKKGILSLTIQDGISQNAIADAKIIYRKVNTILSSEGISYTGQNGKLDKISLYAGDYELLIHRAGYKDALKRLALKADQENQLKVSLEREALAPLEVCATAQEEDKCIISWQRPIHEEIISYAKDEGTARLGVMDYTPHSVLGTVYRGAMAITSVAWKTASHRGPHKSVDLVLFKLDKQGEPTSEILLEKNGIPNQDEEWCRVVFEHPIIAPEGALVALRYNGYLSLYADAGEDAGIDFESNVHVINKDYTSLPFEYLDSHNMRKNFLLKVGTLQLLPSGTPEETIALHTGYELYRKEKESKELQHLATLSKDKSSYVDDTWQSLPMGHYRYYVCARYSDSILSDVTASSLVGKGQRTTIRINVSTNSGALDSTPTLRLTSLSEGKETYQAISDSSTSWICKKIPKGHYALRATLDGFEDILIADLDFTKEDSYEQEILFKELCIKPFNLKAISDKSQKGVVTISWNQADFFFDNLDSYAPFTLEPATPQCNWIYWDRDQDLTREIEGVSFPNAGGKMSFIVFNPQQSNPPLLHAEPSLRAYSGEQYLASFANRNKPCRNFLFSPIMTFEGQTFFEFKVRSLTNASAPERIRVGYTKVEYPKTEEDISWLTDEFTPSDKEWSKASYALPKEAKRAVLGHFSHNAFTIMLDDLFVGEETPYGDGSMTQPITDRAHYTLYIDDKAVLENSKKTSLQLNGITAGSHKARVVASYKSGTSKETSITFDVPTNVNNTLLEKEEVRCYPNPANEWIEVVAPKMGLTLNIYSISGSLEMSVALDHETTRINVVKLPAGDYILQVGNVTQKLLIQR